MDELQQSSGAGDAPTQSESVESNAVNNAWSNYKIKTEVAKNVVGIIAIIIGGGWVLYTFVALKQIEIAEAQIGQTFSRLSIEIKANPVTSPDGTCLVADVFVTNVGTKPVSISSRWGNPDPKSKSGKLTYHPPLAVYKVQFEPGSSGQVSRHAGDEVLDDSLFGHPLTVPAKSKDVYGDDKTHSATVTWELIRVGETRRIPFVVRLREPGMYLVAYRVFVGFDDEEQAIYQKFTGRKRDGATWSSRTYVAVNEVAPIEESPSSGHAAESSDAMKEASKESAQEEEEEEEEEE